MRLAIDLPSEISSGSPVAIELRLTNTGDQPQEVVLQGRPTAFDITVTREDGTQVWRRLEHEVVTAILQLQVLGPGETFRFREVWNQRDARGEPVLPGQYFVTGELPSDPPTVLRTVPARLRIVP